ncbi:MAG: UDP-N-acetylmuramoyl-L-alanyl-D-glutamate--2,6-diaminopimelate ligase [Planctomycetota bacterium]
MALGPALDHAQVMERTAARFFGEPPGRPYRALRSDDRSRYGDLFVAIRGNVYDSHRSIPLLPGRGIRGVVGEDPPAAGFPLPYYQVSSSRRALGRLAQAFSGDPAAALRVLGVTGTNGKSTTVRLLATILEAAGRFSGWMGTVTCHIAGEEHPSSLTTPGPVELARGMSEHLAAGGTDMVLEVSSHALDQERIAGIPLAGALLTNISRDHHDYHGSPLAYRRAKLRLFEHLTPGGPAALPELDSTALVELALRGSRRITFGLSPGADARPLRYSLSPLGLAGTLEICGARVEVQSSLAGRHNLLNILGATALAAGLGIPATAIAGGIFRTTPVPGRMEEIPGREGRVFVDYAHTPDALRAVLDSVRELTRGRVLVVFGCGGERDRGKRPQMGRVVEERSDRAYVTSDNPRGEDPGRIIDEILQGVDQPSRMVAEPDRRAAIGLALADLGREDTLVVAGRGHETCQQILGRALPFDDRRVVAELMRGGGAG